MTVDVWPALEVDLPRRRGREARQEALDAVRAAARDHDKVYLVDRAGLRSNEVDIEFLQEVGEETELWVDAGPRYAEDVVDAFVAGASRVVARWHTIADAGELADVADMSESLCVGLEFEGKRFVENPRETGLGPENLVDRIRRYDLDLVVVGHPDDQGKLACRQHAHAVRGFAGEKCYMGPVRSGEDRDRLWEEGFEGVFVDWSILREEGEHGYTF